MHSNTQENGTHRRWKTSRGGIRSCCAKEECVIMPTCPEILMAWQSSTHHAHLSGRQEAKAAAIKPHVIYNGYPIFWAHWDEVRIARMPTFFTSNPNMEERRMKISITYCVPWNYLPQATSLAAAISDEFGVDAELIKGKNGIFDVSADSDLIFSKETVGRFPQNHEIFEMLRKKGVSWAVKAFMEFSMRVKKGHRWPVNELT